MPIFTKNAFVGTVVRLVMFWIISVADPDPEWEKNPDEHFSESLETIFWYKTT